MARKWGNFPSYAKSLDQNKDADETDGFALLPGPETDKKNGKNKNRNTKCVLWATPRN